MSEDFNKWWNKSGANTCPTIVREVAKSAYSQGRADARKEALIEALKMIRKYADEYAKRNEYSESAKADAWTMTVAAAPILDELGMKWPEILKS